MRVGLFVTCLVDQLWPSVGTATVSVLRAAGCEVVFDQRQTCCGQPAFNTGYRDQARQFARRFLETFDGAEIDAVVSPSGSCTAMVHHFGELFAADTELSARAARLAERTYELSDFLVNVLGQKDVGASFSGRVTWHDACHGLRDLGIRREPRTLLGEVRKTEFVDLPSAESCCGFGGTFSVKYPEISVAIVDQKIDAIEAANVRAVVSGDASCLMQLGGRLSRRGSAVQVMHLAELLASREQ